MSGRPSISRREPVIALKSFRYRGRNYKEGAFLDRRRTRMPNSRLRRFLRDGLCVLAKDVNKTQLLEYGWTYDAKAPRNKLVKIAEEAILTQKNQALIDTFGNDEDDDPPEPSMKNNGGGWYDVMIDGKEVNKTGLRKDDALALIASLKGGK